MFVLSLAAGFRDGTMASARTDAMVRGFPRAPTDGVAFAQTSHAKAAILRWAVVKRDQAVAPIRDEERGLLFAGDARLYNRAELQQALGFSAADTAISDLEVAWRAFLRWGEDAAGRLVGDFAFAAWDDRKRSLFAARDHLGVRPLYYRLLPDGVAIASDVDQLLSLIPHPASEVDPLTIRDLLAPPPRRLAATFFSGIRAVRPGHHLFVTETSCRQQRYWLPSPEGRPPSSYEETCSEIQRLFRRAVRDRLESDRPIIAHSSGGFDSSTIVVVADEIYRSERGRPPLTTASAIAPGYASDESRYIDAVVRQVHFEAVRWNVLDYDPSIYDRGPRSFPGWERGLAGGPLGDIAAAEERGAGTLLSGILGDEVLYAGSVWLDLFRGGRWKDLLTEALGHQRPLPQAARILLKSTLGVAAPAAALRWQRRWSQRRPNAIPDWFGPLMRQLARSPLEPDEVPPDLNWASHVSAGLWDRLTSPHVSHVIDWSVLYGSRRGLEVRLPYADVRLVNYLLSIPWEQRIPRGHLRRTGRDALGVLLPPELQKRRDQPSWAPVWSRNAQAALPMITTVLNEGPWISAPFVERLALQRMLQRAVSARTSPNQSLAHSDETLDELWIQILDLTGLESWLRRLI